MNMEPFETLAEVTTSEGTTRVSTLQVPGVGCVVRVTTTGGGPQHTIAEALTFVPGATVVDKRLIAIRGK